jgi:hypothetical protein
MNRAQDRVGTPARQKKEGPTALLALLMSGLARTTEHGGSVSTGVLGGI